MSVEWEGAHPKSDALVSIMAVPVGGETILFIPHNELLELGYESLEDFAIVRCNGRYFELQGFSEPVESWWVEEIEVPEDPDEEAADSRQSLESMGEGGVEGPGRDA